MISDNAFASLFERQFIIPCEESYIGSKIHTQCHNETLTPQHFTFEISRTWHEGRKLLRNHHLDLILLFLRAPDDPLVSLLPPPAVLLRHVADGLDGELAHQLLHPPQAQINQGGKAHWHHLHPRVFFRGVFNVCQLLFTVWLQRQGECEMCAVCALLGFPPGFTRDRSAALHTHYCSFALRGLQASCFILCTN